MSDASEAGAAVLESQIATQEPLRPDELAHAPLIDSEADESALRRTINGIALRLTQTEAADAVVKSARPRLHALPLAKNRHPGPMAIHIKRDS